MPRTTDAREKAIGTAERLFRVQGYAATGLTQIIEESGSPKGSFYFHFPGGKRELAAEVIAAYRARTTAGFRVLAERTAGHPEKFVRAVAKAVADEMSASGWSAGCVAQTLAQELAPGDTDIAAALAALFDEWVSVIASALGPPEPSSPTPSSPTPSSPKPSSPKPSESARRRALALVAALEGARTLARTQRSAAPFDAVVALFHGETAADRRA